MAKLPLTLIMTLLAGLLTLVPPALAAPKTAPAPDLTRQTLMHDGIERYYLVRTPRNLKAIKGPLPLVLVLHGGGGNAEHAERMTGFTAKVQQEGFILVYPEGTGRLKDKLLTWNARHCCGYAMKNKVDDIGFIRALLDTLTARYPIDPRRIYVTGMSNGGMLTHQLGIALSDRIAAVAPVVAALFGDEKRPLHPVTALIINGQLDDSVPVAGGAPGGRFKHEWAGTPMLPASAQAAFWSQANDCLPAKTESSQPQVTLTRHTCPGGRSVAWYLVQDNGHAWPGGLAGRRDADEPSAALKATDEIWAFFKQHKK